MVTITYADKSRILKEFLSDRKIVEFSWNVHSTYQLEKNSWSCAISDSSDFKKSSSSGTWTRHMAFFRYRNWNSPGVFWKMGKITRLGSINNHFYLFKKIKLWLGNSELVIPPLNILQIWPKRICSWIFWFFIFQCKANSQTVCSKNFDLRNQMTLEFFPICFSDKIRIR